MSKLLFHFHEKDLMPLDQGFFLFEKPMRAPEKTPNPTIETTRRQLGKIGTVVKMRQLENQVIKPKQNTSPTNEVLDCIKNKKPFRAESFQPQKNPIIEKLVSDIAKKRHLNDENITKHQYKEILREVIENLPQEVIPLNVADRVGALGKIKNMLSGFVGEFGELWNGDEIKQNIAQGGKSALILGGITHGLTGIFGLDNFIDITNKAALKKSFIKGWKIGLSGSVAAQAAGIPILQSAGLIIKGGTQAWWETGNTILDVLDSALRPSQIGEILMGKKVLSQKELIELIPKVIDYMKEPEKGVFTKLYNKETGKEIIEIPDDEIDLIAKDLVLLSDDLSTDPLDRINDVDKVKFWQRVQLKTMIDTSALILANHPKERVRNRFEKSVNHYIDLQQKGQLEKLYSKLNPDKSKIDDIVDRPKFKNDFRMSGFSQKLKAMKPQAKKSILEMATQHGFSGLVFLTWFMMKGLFSAVQGIFSVGGKIFGPKNKVDDNKKELNKAKSEPLSNLKAQLGGNIDEVIKKKEWTKFASNLGALGILGTGKLKLEKLKTAERKTLFNKLNEDENKNALDKFAFTKTDVNDISIMSQLQKNIADALVGTKIEIKSGIFGVFSKKSEKGLTQLIKTKIILEGVLKKAGDKKADKTDGRFKALYKHLRGTYRKEATRALAKLNAPPSLINTITAGTKKGRADLDQIVQYFEEIETLYASTNEGKIFIENIKSKKENIIKRAWKKWKG